MSIVERPSYTSKDVEVTSREPLFSGFIQVEKVSLRHRLFNQSEYTLNRTGFVGDFFI
ncbi:aspP [Acinetobacter baumannii]|nr:aspP [Acinetobacter baumannii]